MELPGYNDVDGGCWWQIFINIIFEYNGLPSSLSHQHEVVTNIAVIVAGVFHRVTMGHDSIGLPEFLTDWIMSCLTIGSWKAWMMSNVLEWILSTSRFHLKKILQVSWLKSVAIFLLASLSAEDLLKFYETTFKSRPVRSSKENLD